MRRKTSLSSDSHFPTLLKREHPIEDVLVYALACSYVYLFACRLACLYLLLRLLLCLFVCASLRVGLGSCTCVPKCSIWAKSSGTSKAQPCFPLPCHCNQGNLIMSDVHLAADEYSCFRKTPSSREKRFFRKSFATPSPRPCVCSVRSGAIVTAELMLANTVAAVHLRAVRSVKCKQSPSFALATCACWRCRGTLQ